MNEKDVSELLSLSKWWKYYGNCNPSISLNGAVSYYVLIWRVIQNTVLEQSLHFLEKPIGISLK